jgi:hypothetical protein
MCPGWAVDSRSRFAPPGRREVAEEAGLQNLNLRWGQRNVETPPHSGGKVAPYYPAATQGPESDPAQ